MLWCTKSYHGFPVELAEQVDSSGVDLAKTYISKAEHEACWHNSVLVIGLRGQKSDYQYITDLVFVRSIADMVSQGANGYRFYRSTMMAMVALEKLLLLHPSLHSEAGIFLENAADPDYWTTKNPPIVDRVDLIGHGITKTMVAEELARSAIHTLGEGLSGSSSNPYLENVSKDQNIPEHLRALASAKLARIYGQ